MTEELRAIFFGGKIPKISVVDYTTEEGQAKLKEIIKKQEEILGRKWVNSGKPKCYIIGPRSGGRIRCQ